MNYVWWKDPNYRREAVERYYADDVTPAEVQWRRDMWAFYRERERFDGAGFWTEELAGQLSKEPEFPR